MFENRSFRMCWWFLGIYRWLPTIWDMFETAALKISYMHYMWLQIVEHVSIISFLGIHRCLSTNWDMFETAALILVNTNCSACFYNLFVRDILIPFDDLGHVWDYGYYYFLYASYVITDCSACFNNFFEGIYRCLPTIWDTFETAALIISYMHYMWIQTDPHVFLVSFLGICKYLLMIWDMFETTALTIS